MGVGGHCVRGQGGKGQGVGNIGSLFHLHPPSPVWEVSGLERIVLVNWPGLGNMFFVKIEQCSLSD